MPALSGLSRRLLFIIALAFLCSMGCKPDNEGGENNGDTGVPDTSVEQNTAQITIISPETGTVLSDDDVSLTAEIEWDGDAGTEATLQVVSGFVLSDMQVTLDAQNTVEVGPVTLPPELGSPVRLRLELAVDEKSYYSDEVFLSRSATDRALEGLEQASSTPVRIRMRGGAARTISGAFPTDGSTPVARTRDFLEEHGRALGLENPAEQLEVGQVVTKSDGQAAVEFHQRHLGPYVAGARVVVRENSSGHVVRVLSRVLTELPADVPPISVDPETARELVRAELGEETIFRGDPRLFWYSREIYAGIKEREAQGSEPFPWFLAWRFTGLSPAGHQFFLVDTASEEILYVGPLEYNCEDNDQTFDIYQFDKTRNDDCHVDGQQLDRIECSNSDCDPGASDEILAARNHTVTSLNWYDDFLDRNGIDGCGAHLELLVNYGNENGAKWLAACNQARFSPRWGAVLDVVSHEIAHGTVGHVLGLHGGLEQRAMNEVFPDLLANFTDATRDNGGTLAFEDRVGEDGPGDEPRNAFSGVAWQGAEHIDQFDENESGVFHMPLAMRPIWRMYAGHVEPPFNMTGIGARKLLDLLWPVIELDLAGSSGLEDFRNATVDRALEYLENGEHGFTATDVCSVAMSFWTVGIGPEFTATNCGEVATDYVSDPVSYADDDGDGFQNQWDNCPAVSHFSQIDSDDDGIGDVCDGDDDGDGVPDVIDGCPLTPDDQDTSCGLDSDGDGISDDADNCPLIFNPEQDDTDGSAPGDACTDDIDGDGEPDDTDLCPRDRSAVPNSDVDDDGVGDACDNCLRVPNSRQRDTDGDRDGDACDPDSDDDGVLDDGDGDGEADGPFCTGDNKIDCDDNCPRTKNELQVDHDGNGIGTACDAGEWAADFYPRWEAGLGGNIVFGTYLDPFFAPRIPIPTCMVGCENGPEQVVQVTLSSAEKLDVQMVDQDFERLGVLSELTLDTSNCTGSSCSEQPYTTSLAVRTHGPAFQVNDPLNQTATPSGTQVFLQFLPTQVQQSIEVSYTIQVQAMDLGQAECGNGAVEPGEECDGGELRGATCGGLGFSNGALACSDTCEIDNSACSLDTCGNNGIDSGETCDGTDLGGTDCASFGYPNGTLTCTSTCNGFDTSTCAGCSTQQECDSAFGNSCLVDGTCGTCSSITDCPQGHDCVSGECKIVI